MSSRGAAAVRPVASPADFLDRSALGWHVVWLGVLAVVGSVLLIGDVEPGPAGAGVAAAVGMAVVYLLLGVRLMRARLEGRTHDGRSALYLVVVVAGLLVVQGVGGEGLMAPLLFALFPQIWNFFSRRGAVVATVAVPVVLGLARWNQAGRHASDAAEVAVYSVAQFSISLLLGLWITGLVHESLSRAELLAELERTRADLAATEHARGVLAERGRMAGEIHDTLAQGFTSIVALAQAADAVLDADPALARRRLNLMEDTARENLAEARAIVAALGPPSLAEDRLGGALERLVRRFTEEAGVIAHLAVDPRLPDLAPQTEVVLLRAAQEGLSNVRQHARARTVSVALRLVDGQVELAVVDDGVGLPDQGGGRGYGLAAMAARVQQAGGSLVRESPADGGTALRIRLPPAAPTTAPAAPARLDPSARAASTR